MELQLDPQAVAGATGEVLGAVESALPGITGSPADDLTGALGAGFAAQAAELTSLLGQIQQQYAAYTGELKQAGDKLLTTISEITAAEHGFAGSISGQQGGLQ